MSGASLVAQMVKNLPAVQGTWIWSLGREDPLEKGMVIHYSILPWRIPWTEEPGGLESMELQRVGQDWAQHTHSHTRVTEEGGLWLLEQRWGDRNGHIKPRRWCEYSTESWRFTHKSMEKKSRVEKQERAHVLDELIHCSKGIFKLWTKQGRGLQKQKVSTRRAKNPGLSY